MYFPTFLKILDRTAGTDDFQAVNIDDGACFINAISQFLSVPNYLNYFST